MSDTVDDELLGGEDELDDVYDITQEREDVLLQEEDDYSKGRDFYRTKKRSTDAESEDLDDDVLNLDIEEDFQDEEDKLLYEEEEPPAKKDIKITVENTQVTTHKPMAVPVKVTTMDKRPDPGLKTPDSGFQKMNDFKKTTVVKNGRRKRGNGRGNFQGRSNFHNNNNNMSRRRNGTVLINPRYEGTVHVNESNARLKWDNPQFPPHNNFVQPWNGGNMSANSNVNLQNQLLNVVSGIANSLVQAPVNMLVPPPLMSNIYEPPRSNNYEQPLAFEPPPNIAAEERHSQHSYGNPQNQHPTGWAISYDVPEQINQPMLHPPFSRNNQHQSYNNQISTERTSENSPRSYNSDRECARSYNSHPTYNNSYNHSNAQQNMGLGKDLTRTNSYLNKNSYNRYENDGRNLYTSNYAEQNNFQNTNVDYTNDSYQTKNVNYSDYNPNQNNYTNKYNYNRSATNQANQNSNYKLAQNNFNKKTSNNFPQQNQFKNNFNKSNTFVQRVENTNFNRQGNRRVAGDDFSGPKEVSEKRPRFNQNEQSKQNVQEEKVEKAEKPIETVKQKVSKVEENIDEDEETRQYRLKIEEQKREREKILAIKEERRRQMMLERQQHSEGKLPEVEFKKPNQLNENLSKKPAEKPALFTRKHKFEQSAGTVPVQTVSVQNPKFVQNVNYFSPLEPPHDFNQQQVTCAFPRQFPREPPVMSSSTDVNFPNLTFKISNNLQNTVKDLPKTEASSSSFMSNRVVVVKGKSGVVSNSDMSISASATRINNAGASAPPEVGQGSSFFTSRKVLKKDNNLLNTRLVVVNNLSATFNQSKLMALSRGIGEIQNLRVDTQERQATILFKSVASAHAFFKKYQRRILDDLSVIEVKLEPML